jgi:hypothetical protein
VSTIRSARARGSSTPAARGRAARSLPGAHNTTDNCGNNYDEKDRKSDYQPFRSLLLWLA